MIRPHPPAQPASPGETGCWSRIGIQGDRSCSRLGDLGHCRNCDVYTAAANRLLDRPQREADVSEATREYAQPKEAAPGATFSIVVFRVGVEWLALPTPMVVQVTATRPIHAVPHRRGGALLGLANIRGQLLVCISLRELLGVAGDASAPSTTARFLVVESGGSRSVLPVDEVRGVVRVPVASATEAPSAPARAAAAHAPRLVRWNDLTIGCLDETRLIESLERSLA